MVRHNGREYVTTASSPAKALGSLSWKIAAYQAGSGNPAPWRISNARRNVKGRVEVALPEPPKDDGAEQMELF